MFTAICTTTRAKAPGKFKTKVRYEDEQEKK
jgi:hypothetical protein